MILRQSAIDLCAITPYERDVWAQKDGFAGFEQADDFFMMVYGDEWLEAEAFVIEWNPATIIAKWSEYLKYMEVKKDDRQTRFRIRGKGMY
jgi:hypothetical protein